MKLLDTEAKPSFAKLAMPKNTLRYKIVNGKQKSKKISEKLSWKKILEKIREE